MLVVVEFSIEKPRYQENKEGNNYLWSNVY